ncbi:HdeD family acid-resistance protein [Adlercreutzia sp. ZJ154]|uniref:HdeD family acid-resistance protein n=1 Tax=Adlercreutzia sp. ZJ154 TaxID=2709790 RepID=UPI0013EB8A9C|nr:DUF308 domain-containing protein [Adlercreutzia sp. ZJ154]
MAEQTGTKAKRDWGLVIGGILFFIAGLVMFFWPGLSLVVIAQMAGALMLVGGIVDIIHYFQFRKTGLTSGWAIVSAICSIILGLMFLLHPIVTAGVLPFIVGMFVIAYAIIAIVTAISVRKMGSTWGVMLVNGIISLLCGLMFVFMPDTFAIFLSVLLLMRGITMCILGLTTHSASKLM